MLTFTGKELSKKVGILQKMASFISSKGISIHSISQNNSYVSLFLTQKDGEEIFKEMYEKFVLIEKLFSSMSSIKSIGEITLRNHLFIDSPGVISSISQVLSKNKINIIEMITSHTDIIIYLKFEIMKETIEILKNKFGIK